MKVSYNELIEWLEDYFKKRKLNTYRGLEYSAEFKKDVAKAKKRGVKFRIDPILPIDLVGVKREKGKGFYYFLCWIIVAENPEVEKMLLFYQFYLSRVSEPARVEIIMVLPTACDQKLIKNLKKIAEANKFGLWEVDIPQKTPREICKPKTFRDRMEEEFRAPSKEIRDDPFPKSVQKEAKSITLFFDRYIREAVETMVGITPEQLGKRYIERKVLDLVFKLEKVSYGERLRELVAQHLRQKGNDYDFVSKVFSDLWKTSGLKIEYPEFLKIFEPALHHVFAREKEVYRDHYLHQFQVFLLGVHIIDTFYESFPSQKIEKQWLVASSFHDVAYPVQLYDSWAKEFFKDVFGITEVGASDLRSQFIDKTLLSCMGYLIDSLCEHHFQRPLHANWLANEKELVQYFYKKITKVKHHCILSGLSLLKKTIELNDTDLLKDVFTPAALAITLHDKEVWNGLKQDHGLSMVEFKNDPLAFLLLFCDCVQEWGRPIASDEERYEERKEEERFLLKEIKASKSKYSVTICTPHLSSTNPFFEKTETEVKNLEKFLCQPSNIRFEICLQDKSGRPRCYGMKGV